MASLNRLIRRYDAAAFAAAGLGLALAIILGAFAVAAFSGRTGPGAWAAAAGLLACGGAALLYASRLGAGRLGD